MRITVYEQSGADSHRTMVGWFDRDRAEHFRPDHLHRKHFDDGSGDPEHEQSLYRTSLGRWVLREDRPGDSAYCFLSPTAARAWLKQHGLSDVAARYFAPRSANSGPRKAGRPEVGGPVAVRLGDDLLTEVDNYAGERNVSRADAIRALIKTALADVSLLNVLSEPAR